MYMFVVCIWIYVNMYVDAYTHSHTHKTHLGIHSPVVDRAKLDVCWLSVFFAILRALIFVDPRFMA